jgi:hypothetical protein
VIVGELLGESSEDGVERRAGSCWRSGDRFSKLVWVLLSPVGEGP